MCIVLLRVVAFFTNLSVEDFALFDSSCLFCCSEIATTSCHVISNVIRTRLNQQFLPCAIRAVKTDVAQQLFSLKFNGSMGGCKNFKLFHRFFWLPDLCQIIAILLQFSHSTSATKWQLFLTKITNFTRSSRILHQNHWTKMNTLCFWQFAAFKWQLVLLLLNLGQKRHLDGARDVNGTAKMKIVVSGLSLALQPQLQRLCGMKQLNNNQLNHEDNWSIFFGLLFFSKFAQQHTSTVPLLVGLPQKHMQSGPGVSSSESRIWKKKSSAWKTGLMDLDKLSTPIASSVWMEQTVRHLNHGLSQRKCFPTNWMDQQSSAKLPFASKLEEQSGSMVPSMVERMMEQSSGKDWAKCFTKTKKLNVMQGTEETTR